MKLFSHLYCALVLLWALQMALPSQAADADELESLRETTQRLIQLMVEQGVLTQEKADALLAEAKRNREAKAAAAKEEAKTSAVQDEGKTAAKASPKDQNIVRVPLIPETVKNEIREQVKQEVLTQAKTERWGEPGAIPEWLDRIKLDGDIRLRLQADRFGKSNETPETLKLNGIDVKNSTENRQRLRLRGRLGLQAKLTDKLSANFRIATGSLDDPVSTNVTQGNYNNRFTVAMDRAYLQYRPNSWLTITGGRVPNPWLHTDLVWDEDLNFDGLHANVRHRMFRDSVTGFLTIGAFPIQNVDSSNTNRAKSKWLYGVQGGAEWVQSSRASYKFGLGLYDFKNIQGKPNLTLGSNSQDDTAPQFRQKGNSVFNVDNDGNPDTNRYGLAAKFRELNLTAMADFAAFDPIHIVVAADYVKNIGYDQSEIRDRTGFDIESKTKGYQARVTVGMPVIQNKYDWNTYFAYKYLERDAVVDAFSESDFRLGGTDSKGYIVGGNYGLDKNFWLSAKWLSADAIHGPTFSVDVFQVDLNARF